MIKYFLRKTYGKKRFQGIYSSLLRLSYNGLNIGLGMGESSGEKMCLQILKEKGLINSKSVFFDVGANVGNYTVWIKSIFGKDTIVHAFEPSKKTFLKLQNNVKGFENVILNNLAVGKTKGELKLFYDSEESTLASLYERNLEHIGKKISHKEIVQVETLSNYADNLNIDKIHFLKVDAEGHDLAIFQGAESLINNTKVDFIQFEFGGCNIDSKTYFKDFYYLLKGKFNLYRILKDGLIKVDSYDERSEIFLTTNYLAISKQVSLE